MKADWIKPSEFPKNHQAYCFVITRSWRNPDEIFKPEIYLVSTESSHNDSPKVWDVKNEHWDSITDKNIRLMEVKFPDYSAEVFK